MARLKRSHLERDLLLLASIVVATVALEYYGFYDALFLALSEYTTIASFFAGIFFTSLFTIAPAMAAFAELLNLAPFLHVAIPGALGAAVGDVVLFLFVRDALADEIAGYFKNSTTRWLAHIFKHPLLQWLMPVIGALIIITPLPDELGLTLMGLSRMRLIVMIPISIVMNFLGIGLIWLMTNSL